MRISRRALLWSRTTISLFVVFWSSTNSPAYCDLGIEEIVAAHEATVAQVRTACLVIKHTPVGGRAELIGSQDTWTRRGSMERFTRVMTVRAGPNLPPRQPVSDILLDYGTHTMRRLDLQHPDDRSRLTPTDRRGANAYRAPFDRNLVEFQTYVYFLFRFGLTADDDLRTLRELVEESLRVEHRLESLDGYDCTRLDVIHPGVRGRNVGSRMSLHLDPQFGYLIRQVAIAHEVDDSGLPLAKPYEWIGRVVEFSDFGDGTYLPKSSETFVRDSTGAVSGHNRFEVTNAEVNRIVSDTQVLLEFPEHVLVNVLEEPVTAYTTPRTTDVELMGANGHVAEVFHGGTDEYEAYLGRLATLATPSSVAPAAGRRQMPRNSVGLWFAASAAILLLGFASLRLWRRARCSDMNSPR